MQAASDEQLNILAFEPFDGGSHHAVRLAITQCSRHRWTWITRPARHWKWRMRIGAVEMIENADRQGALDQPIDVIFATSLLSTADLRSLLPGHMRTVPVVFYMHENQAAYPHGDHRDAHDRQRDVQFALTNLTSILSAERVLWNSQWNRDSFLDGIRKIFRTYPDRTRDALRINDDMHQYIIDKSAICWPPVDVPDGVLHNRSSDRNHTFRCPEKGREQSPPLVDDVQIVRSWSSSAKPIRVVWPHRWEHDKGPDELLAIAEQHTVQSNLRWIILGEQFRRVPPSLEQFRARFGPGGLDRIDHLGFVDDRADYWTWLRQADWVLSTAKHEFFGIAVTESLLAGCLPWLPNRLSYPEVLPDANMFELSPMQGMTDDDMRAVRDAIRQHLEPAMAANAVCRIDTEIESATVSEPV